jgi:hypothetical protein
MALRYVATRINFRGQIVTTAANIGEENGIGYPPSELVGTSCPDSIT